MDPSNTNQESYVEIIGFDDQHLSYQCTPENACIDALQTQVYGNSKIGARNVDINQGVINEITSWGVLNGKQAVPCIANLHWKSDKQTTFNDEYGWAENSIIDSCIPYTLEDDDYINQYRIVYNNETIYGIYFKTMNDKLLQCASNKIPPDAMDSGDILYPNRYLSGFYVVSSASIQSVSFQFTAMNNTNKCKDIVTDNIIIENAADIEEEWVAFYILNADLSCGGTISNIEITDNNSYIGKWIQFDEEYYSLHDQALFQPQNMTFTAPITIRITRHHDSTDEVIVGNNIIKEFIAGLQDDFGSNFCITQTFDPTIIPTSKPTDNPIYNASGAPPDQSTKSSTSIVLVGTASIQNETEYDFALIGGILGLMIVIMVIIMVICAICVYIVVCRHIAFKNQMKEQTESNNLSELHTISKIIPKQSTITPPGMGEDGDNMHQEQVIHIQHNNYHNQVRRSEGVQKAITNAFEDSYSSLGDVNENILNETLKQVLNLKSIDKIKGIQHDEKEQNSNNWDDSDIVVNGKQEVIGDNEVNKRESSEEMYDNVDEKGNLGLQTTTTTKSSRKQTGDV